VARPTQAEVVAQNPIARHKLPVAKNKSKVIFNFQAKRATSGAALIGKDFQNEILPQQLRHIITL